MIVRMIVVGMIGDDDSVLESRILQWLSRTHTCEVTFFILLPLLSLDTNLCFDHSSLFLQYSRSFLLQSLQSLCHQDLTVLLFPARLLETAGVQ